VTEQEQTVSDEFTSTTHTTFDEGASYETPLSENLDISRQDQDLDLSSLNLSSHSTPRPQSHQRIRADDDLTPSSIAYSSPREGSRQEEMEEERTSLLEDATPRTPGRFSRCYKNQAGSLSETPLSSPFIPPVSHAKASTAKKSYQKPTDPILHRVLDKTYRVQATPLAKGFSRAKLNITTPRTKSSSRYLFDDSPISSPEMEAPKLHEEIFASPIKIGGSDTIRKRRTSSKAITPKPGISVLTPGKKLIRKSTVWDSDDDEDDLNDNEFGLSPPKTMQFHIPQNRLIRSPGM
jgi:DASH complex subunit ASK1